MRRLLAVFALTLLALPLRAAPQFAPGDYRFELPAEGRTRSYLLHVPPQGASQRLPLVVSLHGGGGNAGQHRKSTGMDAAADRDGYIVAYPNGSGRSGEDRLLTWNAGNCCAYAQLRRVDDVGFIAAVIDDAQRRAAVDPRRVYAVGHSNGGMMAHRLGEALPDRIAAIASVAGVHVPAAEPSGRAMPVLHVHSVDDPQALYHGGLGPPPLPFASMRILHSPVDDMLGAWLRRDGCNRVPKEGEFRADGKDTAQELRYGGCRDGAAVVLWKLTGAGHAWPGGRSARARAEAATRVIDANAEVWKFFSQFALPER